MRRWILAVLLAFGVFGLMACTEVKEDQQQEENESENENDINIEETPSEEQEKEPVEIQFMDAFGKVHQGVLNPNVKLNEYSRQGFSYNGQKLSYDDSEYTSRLGVDVSYYQGEVDWEKVKADGYEFAFIRLGFRGYGKEGSLNLDKQYENNIVNASAAGLDVGVYFFAQAINEEEAIEEAEFVLEHLEGYELQLPIVYDPETVHAEDARTKDVTGEQYTKNALAFCRRIEEAGYDAMIYCNLLWQIFELDLEILKDYPLWYADYELLPQTPYFYEFWQYSDAGEVSGIDSDVDLNIQIIKKQ